MTDILTMAAQMALCCVLIGVMVFGVMWVVFYMATWWERRG